MAVAMVAGMSVVRRDTNPRGGFSSWTLRWIKMKGNDMNWQNSEYGYESDDMGSLTVAQASVQSRASFLFKTYLHLVGAILLFVAIEVLFFSTPAIRDFGEMLLTTGRMAWLGIMVLFVVAATLANSLAHSERAAAVQYLGLGLYALIEAVIFLPILLLAEAVAPEAISQAAWATAIIFTLLTAAVLVTRQDFSFLRSLLFFASFALIAVAIAAMFFGTALMTFVIWFGIALACGYILYDTSNVIHYYRPDQYVAASLALFASVMLLFWYVLQLFISRRQ